MPRNTEYLIYAYGIAITVISVYFLRMFFRLRSVRKKLDELSNREKYE
ncbi:MAG: CcmD family protein [Deltaproteobacteria bacterium]|jgi:CcmD family protein|nr:CcmD family protein [Deltaproteobacteria bacterium]MBT4087579.1 CcmD family protein [Deltaproteobacteria bacterium]MBT4263592.1 CcmD family protein [Deltaproteobacteria bacterium]MBT4644329.1 CcmD family protein [Deltaproteobacteria bacterium]MBT6500410.1 CcmD family protein [Deltaproteobacteria bacterium]